MLGRSKDCEAGTPYPGRQLLVLSPGQGQTPTSLSRALRPEAATKRCTALIRCREPTVRATRDRARGNTHYSMRIYRLWPPNSEMTGHWQGVAQVLL